MLFDLDERWSFEFWVSYPAENLGMANLLAVMARWSRYLVATSLLDVDLFL
jgi:hypothetical protein